MKYVVQRLVFLLSALMEEHVRPSWMGEARKHFSVFALHSLLVCTVKQQVQEQMVIFLVQTHAYSTRLGTLAYASTTMCSKQFSTQAVAICL